MPIGAAKAVYQGYQVAAAADQVYEVALGIGNRIDLYEFDTADDSFTYDTTLNPNVGTVACARISPNGDLLACCGNSGDFFAVYEKSGGTWSKQTKPTGAPSDTATEGVAFSNDGNYLFFSSFTDRAAYSISGTTLTALTITEDSAGQDNDRSQGCTVSADGTWWFIADRYENEDGSLPQGGVKVYKRTGTTLDLTQNLNPSYRTQRVAVNSDATEIAVTTEATPFVHIYTRTGDTWSETSNPLNTTPEEGRRDVAYSHDDEYFVQVFNVFNAPVGGAAIWKSDGDGTYTRLEDSATGGPLNEIYDTGWRGGQVAWTSGSEYLLIGAATNSGTVPILNIWSNNGDDTFTQVVNLLQDSAGEDVECVGVYPGYHG